MPTSPSAYDQNHRDRIASTLVTLNMKRGVSLIFPFDSSPINIVVDVIDISTYEYRNRRIVSEYP